MTRCYEYRTTVTIGETNSLQNMYFHNYFKLQGVVRELSVRDCVANGLTDIANGLTLITKNALCHFKKDFFLYYDILVRFFFSSIRKTNCGLNFQFINAVSGEEHAEGVQTIVFANSEHKVIKIPINWVEAISSYMQDAQRPALITHSNTEPKKPHERVQV